MKKYDIIFIKQKMFYACKVCVLGCLFVLCSNTGYAQIAFEWARELTDNNGNNNDAGDIVTDLAGNVYITGMVTGAGRLGNDTPVSATQLPGGAYSPEIFIAKMDPAGNYIWQHIIGNDEEDRGLALASDNQGYLYITGRFRGSVDFDPGAGTSVLTSAGNNDLFLLKLDTAGNFVWVKQIGGKLNDAGSSIACDHSGFLYLTGSFGDTVDFDPGPGTFNLISSSANTLPATSYNAFVLKLDTAGQFIWARSFNTTSNAQGVSIAVSGSPTPSVYTLGNFAGTVAMNPGTASNNLTAATPNDIFISRLDTAGNYIWAEQFGGTSAMGNLGFSLVPDEEGNIYISGYCNMALNMSTFAITSQLLVRKLDTAGNTVWTKLTDGNALIYGTDISIDRLGGVYTTGYFNGPVDFNFGGSGAPAPTATNGQNDIFILKLDQAGSFDWVKTTGSTLGDEGQALTLDASSNLYITGTFRGSVDFDPDPAGAYDLDASGQISIFVQKFTCNNTSTSTLTVHRDSCNSFTLLGNTYTASGVYELRIPNTSGCDSVIILDLTITNDLGVDISVDEYDLSTISPYQHYHWLLNGDTIPGATNRNYTVTENGDYSVKVWNEPGCEDTSRVYSVNNVFVRDMSSGGKVVVYPNPVQDVIYISSPVPVNAVLTGVDGRKIVSLQDAGQIATGHLAKGVYLLHITDQEGRAIRTEKVVKE